MPPVQSLHLRRIPSALGSALPSVFLRKVSPNLSGAYIKLLQCRPRFEKVKGIIIYMNCANCGSQFPNWIRIDGRLRCLKNRKYCLECSPFKSHNTIKIPAKGGYCISCGKELTGNQTKYCSDFCKGHAFNYDTYKNTKIRAIERKLHFVQLLGGCCARCGYEKNLTALTFHHLNPATKQFNLDARSLASASFEAIEAEVKQCILLCHNCHHELHHPEMTIYLLRLKSRALPLSYRP
jgi:5-methylcytosine-specific restriction endonuclease McrA